MIDADRARVPAPLHNLATLTHHLTAVTRRPTILLATHQLAAGHPRCLSSANILTSAALNLVLFSTGGCVCCAYAIARNLRRQARQLTVYVPWLAKSAATLVALAGDDLVMADRAELGPLDGNYQERQAEDVPVERSCMDHQAVLSEVRRQAQLTFEAMFDSLTKKANLRAVDACQAAGRLSADLWSPFLARIDPTVMADSTRTVELGKSYLERILRRYRSDLYEEHGQQIIDRLITGYPDHKFVIDREELVDIGVPVRAPSTQEAQILEQMAAEIRNYGVGIDFVQIVEGPDNADADLPGPILGPDGEVIGTLELCEDDGCGCESADSGQLVPVSH